MYIDHPCGFAMNKSELSLSVGITLALNVNVLYYVHLVWGFYQNNIIFPFQKNKKENDSFRADT